MNGKLREALTKVSDVLETWCDHLPPIIQDEVKEALALADEALAEPPRNCERFDNANDAFAAYAEEQMPEPNSYDDWLFAVAKGENDGDE